MGEATRENISQRLCGIDLMKMVLHDLRLPLTAIAGYCKLAGEAGEEELVTGEAEIDKALIRALPYNDAIFEIIDAISKPRKNRSYGGLFEHIANPQQDSRQVVISYLSDIRESLAERLSLDAENSQQKGQEAKEVCIDRLTKDPETNLLLLALNEIGLLMSEQVSQIKSILSEPQLEDKTVNFVLGQSQRFQDLIGETHDIIKLTPNWENVNIVSIIKKITTTLEPLAKGRPIILQIASDSIVRADPLFVERILTNLVGNGIRYSKPDDNKPIKVEGYFIDHQYRISITDQGIGLDQKTLGDVRRFKPGFRAQEAVQHDYNGTGYGLFLSHVLATRLGGCLEVGSPGENRGSTFTLVLPE